MTEDTHEELCAVPEGKEVKESQPCLEYMDCSPTAFDLHNDTKAKMNAKELHCC